MRTCAWRGRPSGRRRPLLCPAAAVCSQPAALAVQFFCFVFVLFFVFFRIQGYEPWTFMGRYICSCERCAASELFLAAETSWIKMRGKLNLTRKKKEAAAVAWNIWAVWETKWLFFKNVETETKAKMSFFKGLYVIPFITTRCRSFALHTHHNKLRPCRSSAACIVFYY